MLVVVTLYVSNNKKKEYQWDTVKTALEGDTELHTN